MPPQIPREEASQRGATSSLPRWLVVVTAILFALQLIVAARAFWETVRIGTGIDWMVLVEGGRRVSMGLDPYETDVYGVLFRWSPLAAWAMVAIAPGGILLWRVVNLGSVLLLRDWRLILLALLSWPLWDAMFSGTVTILVVTVGFAALSGSRWASLAYLALFALLPRPWMLPLGLWLVWKRKELRVPAVAIAALGIAGAIATGWGYEWLRMLIASRDEMANAHNLGPTRLLGPAWFFVGVPLAAWLTMKGRVGLAGLAVSPYLFAHYYLALLWEAPQVRRLLGLQQLGDADAHRPNGQSDLPDIRTISRSAWGTVRGASGRQRESPPTPHPLLELPPSRNHR